MSWPSPPADPAPCDPPPEEGQPVRSPWRPAPEPSVAAGTAGAGEQPGPGPARGRRTRVVPLAVGAAGVVALLAAGWVAVDRGLLGSAGASGSPDRSLADIARQPSEAWSYTYLPRSAEATMNGYEVAGDAVYLLTTVASSDDPSWSLQRVSLADGEQDWSIDLDPPSGTGEPGGASLLGVVDDRIYVTVGSYDADSYEASHTHHVFATRDGEQVGAHESGPLTWAVLGDGLYQVDEDELSRLDPDDPEGPVLWTAIGDGTLSDPHHQDGHVVLPGETTTWVDADTGEEPPWLTEVDPALSYQLVGGQVYRTESGTRGSFLERLDDDGSVSWSADADSFRVVQDGSGAPVVLALESGGSEGAGYEYLQRLDPRDGEEMWEDGLEADFDAVSWVLGDALVLESHSSGRAEVYSLDDAERLSRLRGSVSHVGARTLYSLEDGRLSAADLEGEQLWTVRARGAGSLLWAPGYLITHDSEAGRLTRWE